MATRVLVAAGIRLYRDGLRQLLQAESAVEVVGTTASGPEALAAIEQRQPEVVLLDVELTDAPALIRATAGSLTGPKVVVLGMPDSDDNIVVCLEAGAAGYVPREGSLAELLDQVESAARGEVHCSPRVAGRLAERVAKLANQVGAEGPHPELTTREGEVVALIEQGLSNKQIAARLCIEVSTVKNHVHRILEKLHVNRRGQIAAQARRDVPRDDWLELRPRAGLTLES